MSVKPPEPYQVKIQAFEGPLDILLNLIEERKLEITQISLAEVTAHFIEYVENERIPAGTIAQFLSVAARLLLIKTKALLPFLTLSEEEEEELVDLETRLKLLARFREAGKHLRKCTRQKRYAFGRELLPAATTTFYPPQNITADTLHVFFKRIADDFKAFFEKQQYAAATIQKVVSLEERVRHLMQLIEQALEKRFHDVVVDAKNKMEVIVTFLAMLELIKQHIVDVEQQGIFGEITIRKTRS